MRRYIARFFFVVLIGSSAMVLGVATSMTLTPPGRALLARMVPKILDRIINGEVEVGAISGSFLYDVTLENLVVRDTSGTLLADLPRVRASYRLANLLAKRILLSSVELERPTIHLIKHRNGRMNYEEVLGLGKGKPGGGPSPLIEFLRVRVDSGSLSIATPWNPPREARTDAARDSALRAERAKPGRVIAESPEGLRKVITLADLTTRISRLRIATPDRKPFTIDLDSLATRVNDPGIHITDAAGRVRIRGDSAIVSLERGALPDTRFSGGGAVTWPTDTVLFDFQLVSPQVNLEDLRWVSPDFPAMRGSGVLAARSENGQRTIYDITELKLEGTQGRAEGELVAITDRRRGLGVRDMNLRLRQLDLDVARPYLDTLPFYGTLTGTMRGSGFLDALDLTVDWAFADARVPDNPITRIAGSGRVGSHPVEGLIFTQFAVASSDIDLRTVRLIAPAVIVDGRLNAVGTLDGPLHNATFRGAVDHQDGARPRSHMEGMVRLDTRADTLALATDLVLNPLVFDGIRPAFPSLHAQGALQGRVVSEGTLARLAVDASLHGEIGAFDAQGYVTLLPPKWGADDLLVRFRQLDLAALAGRDAVRTRLNGQLRATGSIDTLRAPNGTLEVALQRSLVRGLRLDTLFTSMAVRDSVLTVDTVYAALQGARAGGSGSLGWAAPHRGEMLVTLAADTLGGFDSLLLAVSEQERDTAPDARPLAGRARSTLRLAGSLDSLVVGGDAVVEEFTWQRYRSPRITSVFAWTGGARPSLSVGASADSLVAGDWSFRRAVVQARGLADSLDWSAGTTFGSVASARAPSASSGRVDGAGRWWRQDHTRVLVVDTLRAALPVHTYRLRETATLTLSDSAPALTPVTLEAEDGSGAIHLGGRLPGTAPGALTVAVHGLNLQDVYGLLQRDTTGIDGDIGIDLKIAGTAAAPTFKGTAQLEAARFGTFRAPSVQSTIDYANRKLDATLVFWRTGERVLDVDAHLPLDLAFRGVKRRQLDGPLTVRAHTDSVDLAILEAVTPAVRDVRGRLSGDVEIGGTWKAPRLSGNVAVSDGAMAIPGLGVRFDYVGGQGKLQGDSILLSDVRLESGGGTLAVGGAILLDTLTRPKFALDFRADRFLAMNVRNLGTLTASTEALRLRGPFFGAQLEGSLTANSGVIYFADLINKQVINLEDPAIADLVDTMRIRRENLGAGFQSRFLDSLKINNLQVQLGSDVWLRSAEANVQLDGAVRVSKVAREYSPSGTVRALRGSYTLKIGPVTRDFTVQEGTVQYEGDLNANLNIRTQHIVRTIRDEEIPIIARIEGQLYAPKLTLETARTPVAQPDVVRPNLSQTDLVAYLITGRSAGDAMQFGRDGGALQTGLAYFSSALSSEFERAVIQDLRVPLDLLEIRPGVASETGTTLTQLAAGWQIGRKTFLTFNAGFCPENLSQVSSQNLGVNFEFRFSREWRLQTSVEPTLQTCTLPSGLNTSRQFGTDIFWEREF